MLTYKIHLIRHGLTRANLEGKYSGLTDYPLCQEGIDKLRSFSQDKIYPSLEKIYTSPLRRCRETAQELFPGWETEDIPLLSELDFGVFEGKTLEELKDDEAFIEWSRDSMNNPPPQGEDGVAFIRRIIDGIDSVFRKMMDNRLTNVALIVPGGIIMTALALMGFPRKPMGEWDCPNGGGYTIIMTPELWTRDKIFEVMCQVPMSEEELSNQWGAKKYYNDGEEEFFE